MYFLTFKNYSKKDNACRIVWHLEREYVIQKLIIVCLFVFAIDHAHDARHILLHARVL
jgi:hypothetical protein